MLIMSCSSQIPFVYRSIIGVVSSGSAPQVISPECILLQNIDHHQESVQSVVNAYSVELLIYKNTGIQIAILIGVIVLHHFLMVCRKAKKCRA
jgi:hypothetical protein